MKTLSTEVTSNRTPLKAHPIRIVLNNPIIRGLSGLSRLFEAGFQAEFSAKKETPNSVTFEDTKASCCGLYGLDASVESFGPSVADW
ncbi:MAG: hypothetical protein RLZZ536_892 [Planctomycetota bacterium]|jgi:hypothetical protein